MMTIKEFQHWFDNQFLPLLGKKSAAFLHQSDDEEVRRIIKHIMTVAKGGKRFRPYMAYVGYVSEGGEEEIFPLYAAIELLHLFCLVHDDIIDDEPVRHASLTMHKHVERLYGSEKIGRSVAILIGDLLLAWAFECLEEVERIEPYTADEAAVQFRLALIEVIHGQLLDVLSLTQKNQTKASIEKKMLLKSARYSFFNPLYIGMLTAGADEEIKDFAEQYCAGLGMAFQLQDDIDDCIDDIQEHRHTLLTWYMRNVTVEKDKELFELYCDQEWSDEEEEKLLALLEGCGALPFARRQVEEYFLKAEDAIFSYDKHEEEIWHEIIDVLRRVV